MFIFLRFLRPGHGDHRGPVGHCGRRGGLLAVAHHRVPGRRGGLVPPAVGRTRDPRPPAGQQAVPRGPSVAGVAAGHHSRGRGVRGHSARPGGGSGREWRRHGGPPEATESCATWNLSLPDAGPAAERDERGHILRGGHRPGGRQLAELHPGVRDRGRGPGRGHHPGSSGYG